MWNGVQTIVGCSYYMGKVRLYTSSGSASTLDASFSGAWGVTSFDGDGDGDKDVAVIGSGGGLKYWRNDSGSLSNQYTDVDGDGYGVTFGDFDGDGDIDIGGGFVFTWWANNGSGTSWSKTVVDSANPGSTAKCAADLDGDGDPDLVLTRTGSNMGLGWYKNN